MKTFIPVMMSILILFFLVTVKAQTPVGLYEGLLGNTGAALTDSSAASYYNPSLLALKVSDSYALSGSTLNNFESKSLSEKTTSISIYPSYLSSIFISESLSHEIFLVNLSPTRIKNLTTGTVGSTYSSSETHRDGNQILAGYSMAFRKLGFALSYFIQYDQIQEFGFSETADLNGTLRITSNRKGNYSSMAGGISVSGYNQFNHYTFGYNLKMRPAVFYTKNEAKNKNYIRGETLPTDYRESEENLKLNISGPISTTLIIGHSFKNGDHEFLTDSRFSEKSNNNKAFDFYQSFGYRLTSSSGHQFLCGLSHSFGGDTSFFGQNLYLSTGYSWLNKINRSTFGLYYFKSQLTAEITALGLTFGGEFSY